jgi:hypothetical protein
MNYRTLHTAFYFLLSAFCILSVSAQRYPYELSIYAEGGVAGFACQKPISKVISPGFGGDAGVGFTYFFSQYWGIHTGAGFGFFDVKNRITKINFITPDQIDCNGYLNNWFTAFNYYNENHKILFVTLPLMIQYQTKMQPISHQKRDKRAGFYAKAGAKALFLIDNKYTTGITSFRNEAYYPDFDNWISDQPEMGLGTFRGITVNDKLKFNLLVMFAFEAGFKWQIGKKMYLYTGIYYDCGLYDYTKKHRVPYTDFILPEHLDDFTLLDVAKRMNLMAGGLKLRLAFQGQKTKGCCP